MGIEVSGHLGKTVCSLAALDTRRAVVFRKGLQRYSLLNFYRSCAPVSWRWKRAR